jgi:G:T-mismatch repair DNA endonuclease (very short patch repair protein)
MPVEKREALIEWYAEAQQELTDKGTTYNFKDEIRKYCANDCYILRRACTAFREMFIPLNVDPFQETFTLASLANTVLRRNFYEDKAIGIIPRSDSYRSSQSVEALKYLVWLQKEQNLPNLKYAGNGTEQVILGAPVDGYDEATKTVYQFHGDYFHGCNFCYTNVDALKNPRVKQQLIQRRQETQMRTAHLRRKGYKVVEMHECQWKKKMLDDPVTYNRISEDPIVTKGYLRSRDAFFGGRTNALKLFYEAKPDEVIRLLDFKSLYPTTNKWLRYPVKHPKVYTEDFPPLLDVHGLIHCKVLPPGNLYNPVLPEKLSGKLLFHLCSKCGREKKDDYCTHTDDERAILGTWVSYELHLALKMGYTVQEVYEVWDYPETRQYDKDTGENGLFNQYVDIFVKMKQVRARKNS